MLEGLSSLLILRKILYRLKARCNLAEVPLASNVFDLAGGMGTGGVVVILLFRLKLPIEFAVKIYPEVVRILSDATEEGSDENGSDGSDSDISRGSSEDADNTRDSEKTAILIQRIQVLLGIHTPSRGPAQVEMLDLKGKCKGLVCTSHENKRNFPIVFRTWKPHKNETHNCTIFEALLATFSPSGIAITNQYGIKSTFVSADLPWNNPLSSVWQEGKIEFGADKISCVVSIGAGSETRTDSMTLLSGVLREIGKNHNISVLDSHNKMYIRFNAGKGRFDATPEFDTVELIHHHVMSYLEGYDVGEMVDELVDLLDSSSSMRKF